LLRTKVKELFDKVQRDNAVLKLKVETIKADDSIKEDLIKALNKIAGAVGEVHPNAKQKHSQQYASSAESTERGRGGGSGRGRGNDGQGCCGDRSG